MLLSAERVIHDGYAYKGVGIDISDDGHILGVGMLREMGKPDVMLSDRVLIPGFVNAHSHSFQRLLRGRTQFCGPDPDTFWTWREAMYWVSEQLDPHDVYVVARQAFTEMLLGGVTTVGEFHYLLNQPDGEPYENPHALAYAIIEAARDTGIRLSLIRTVYLHGDFDEEPSPQQLRFCDPSVDVACLRFDELANNLWEMRDPRISWAIAAHSLRGVSFEELMSLKLRLAHMPFHLHISEHPREVRDCIEKYGAPPVALLARSNLLDSCTTLIHATHLRAGEAQSIADKGALVCMCPSTEADLGDGLGPAATLHALGVGLCLGTDGQTMSSILSEARRVEMHERLRLQQRNVLGRQEGDSVAAQVLKMATHNGATSLGIETGSLRGGRWADFTSFSLKDSALLGADEWALLPALIFSSDSRAIRDVMVGGKFVVQDGIHPQARETADDFTDLCEALYPSSDAVED